MEKVPKAKCEQCANCKLVTEYGIVVCDYLNGFSNLLFAGAFNQPQLCPNFTPIKKRRC